MNKFNKFIVFFAYLIVVSVIFVCLDIFILNKVYGFGSQRLRGNWFELECKVDYPYVGFLSRDIANTEPYSIYYTGRNIYENNENKIKIAVFGGSTAAFPDESTPNSKTLPAYIEEILKEKLNKDVVVINYACGGAHHRQHLHMLLEFLPKFKPDIVLFYGGNNETVQALVDDSRFSYPFNYVYKAEVPTWQKCFFEYSALGGVLFDKIFFNKILWKVRDRIGYYLSPKYFNDMADNYFDTLNMAKKITDLSESDIFGNTIFVAIFQPIRFKDAQIPIDKIRDKIPSVDYIYDFYNKYDKFDDSVWFDNCHVKDEANRHMANEIANLLTDKYLRKYKK